MKPDKAQAHGHGKAHAQAGKRDARQGLQTPRSDSASGALPATPATLAYLAALHNLLDWAPAGLVPRRQSIKFGKLKR
ncbi:MAG: hypothetical protein IH627_12375 [Rubrivivax sp.]|nr:hypothetical protein [Rubrivivax sp.]